MLCRGIVLGLSSSPPLYEKPTTILLIQPGSHVGLYPQEFVAILLSVTLAWVRSMLGTHCTPPLLHVHLLVQGDILS